MTHVMAKVREDRLLELPKEAQERVMPGQMVDVDLPDASTAQAPKPNEKALHALRTIAERQKGRPHTDGSDTLRLIAEARGGAMYDIDPTD